MCERAGVALRRDWFVGSEAKMMLVFPKWRKPKCSNTWAFWDLMLWTASKSSPARLIDSDNIRQIVSTIWVYMQAEQLELFNPNRLPQAPYCTRGKGEAVVIRRLQSALRNPLIKLIYLCWLGGWSLTLTTHKPLSHGRTQDCHRPTGLQSTRQTAMHTWFTAFLFL